LEWYIVESDSNDDTLIKLKYLSEIDKDFKYTSLGKIQNQIECRTERISYCRNIYLEEIVNNPIYANIDYVIVADLDGINNKLTNQSVKSCFTHLDWEVCTANQDGPYYDIYALRHPLWSSCDYQHQINFISKFTVDLIDPVNISLVSKMIKIRNDADWIEVDSSFGGIAIYKKSFLVKCRYSGYDSAGNEVCEHVPLHENIKKYDGRIFINPRFINADYTEHTYFLRLRNKIFSKIKNFIKLILNALFKIKR
jgi:hypothetical protein